MHDILSPILVVDDEPVAAGVTELVLHHAGYLNIETAYHPAVALKIISGKTPPALIVTDFNMPFMNGLELLEEARRICPSIKGIIITANAFEVRKMTEEYFVIDKGGNFIYALEEYVKVLLKE